MDINERKQIILNTIIKEHIKTGAPVGSNVLVNKYKLNISPATVRNKMAELENEGFIIQPHTSAGRIPTERAYNLYIKNLCLQKQASERKLGWAKIKMFKKILGDNNKFPHKSDQFRNENFKQTAKEMAKISNNAVFWAFHKHNLYYTGISNLLQQPEFMRTNLIYDISVIIDRVDEIIDDIFDDIKDGIQILVGSNNPFGNFCSTILAKYKLEENIGMFGILGPMRMDYEKNLALVKFVCSKIINNNK